MVACSQAKAELKEVKAKESASQGLAKVERAAWKKERAQLERAGQDLQEQLAETEAELSALKSKVETYVVRGWENHVNAALLILGRGAFLLFQPGEAGAGANSVVACGCQEGLRLGRRAAAHRYVLVTRSTVLPI